MKSASTHHIENPGLAVKPRPAPRWASRLLAPLQRARHGQLTLQLPDSEVLRFGDAESAFQVRVTLHRWAALRKTLTGGSLGWSESYLDGDWDSPDIAAFVQWVLCNEACLGEDQVQSGPLSRLLARLRHALHRNSRRGSRRNIAYHYDLGNDFYRLWLDETMSYSSALFRANSESLARAQQTKYQRIIDSLQVTDGASVLEIGCGWGGFAEQLAAQRDVRLHGITLSERQLDYARQRLNRAGLDHRTAFSLTDYRDIRGEYDHIVSIEMLEAVGEAYWPTYFDTLYRRLKPGGSAAIQVITIADERFAGYRADPDFIQTYIFPGGMLPSPRLLRQHADEAGLRVSDVYTFGKSYARTLRLWHEQFEQAWPDIAALGFDQRFHRLWRYYLNYCEGGFRAGSIDVCQLLLRKP